MSDTVRLDLSQTGNGDAPFTISDGIETVEYTPSNDSVEVAPGHLGAALGALPGATVAEDAPAPGKPGKPAAAAASGSKE